MSPHDAPDASPSSEPDFDEDEDSSTMAEEKKNSASGDDQSTGNVTKPAKNNSKDPSRHAERRRGVLALLGDERPCTRCIKRGLQDTCQDGHRKKAKYLHDAPPEALIPGYHQNYQANGSNPMSSVSGAPASMPATQPGTYYPNAAGSYSQYSPLDQPSQMSQQLMDGTTTGANSNQQQPPILSSPTQYQQPPNQQISPVQRMGSSTLNQPPDLNNITNPSFEASMFDPNDQSFFNFPISDYNFGSQYGALEFGMLGHMTSGAVNTPEMELMDMSHSNPGSISYDGTSGFPTSNFPFTQGGLQNWHTANRQGSSTALWALQHNGMDAYAVAENSGSLTGASPHSQSQDWSGGYQSSNVSPEAPFAQLDNQRPRRPVQFPSDFGPLLSRKRRARDTKQIYASVKKPYPYTEKFHNLTTFLNKRFPTNKRLRIAKAFSSFRPSFISLAQDLSEDDLIFMEQGFQRQLVEYDDAWQQTGTPSIICRRTGEVVSCNKEFSLVTGWRRDVLLGKEPNLNVNFGSTAASGTQTGTSTRGAATPRIPAGEPDNQPQAVFLAELMDQDSSVQFWEDFAERAFGGSNAAMHGANVSLLKYKTKEDAGWAPAELLAGGVKKQEVKMEGGGAGMGQLGEVEGRIEMGMTWLVRRDMFDIPMMIVFNFLPII